MRMCRRMMYVAVAVYPTADAPAAAGAMMLVVSVVVRATGPKISSLFDAMWSPHPFLVGDEPVHGVGLCGHRRSLERQRERRGGHVGVERDGRLGPGASTAHHRERGAGPLPVAEREDAGRIRALAGARRRDDDLAALVRGAGGNRERRRGAEPRRKREVRRRDRHARAVEL